MTTHTADGMMFTGLGVDVVRLATIASAFKLEARGMRMTRRAPPMTTVVARDYGMKIKRSPEGKDQAAVLFTSLSRRLGAAIQANEVEHLARLAAVRSDGPAFIKILMEMLN